jgi:hypothetical protein
MEKFWWILAQKRDDIQMNFGKTVCGDVKNEMQQGTHKYRNFVKTGTNTQLI